MPPAPSPDVRLQVLWSRLSPLPGGSWLFNLFLRRLVPYSGALGARVRTLEPGRARLTLRDRRAVRNHLRSVHAVALTNLGELTSGLAMLGLLPPTIRGIVVRLEVSFHKKARGPLVADSESTLPSIEGPTEHTVRTHIRDREGDEVATVTTHWLLGPRPGAEGG